MSAVAAPSLATSEEDFEAPKVQKPKKRTAGAGKKAPLTSLIPADLALLESKVDEIWSWTPAEEILQHNIVDTSLTPLPEGNALRPLYKSPRGQPFYVRPTGWVNNVNHPSVQEGAPLLKPQLPRDAGKPCLVLDMDETLLCAQEAEEDPEQVRNFKINHSFVVDIMVPYSEGYGAETFMVSKRPGCDELLRTLSQHYELVLFTHSKQAYADALMNLIDPEGLISSRLYRPAVSVTNSGYFKDLTLLGRPMEKVVLVDDNPGCTDQFPENSISCYGYGGLRRDDPELFRITRFLSLPEVYGAPDIRVALKLYTARQHKYKEEEIKKWQAKQAEEKKKEEERKAALKRAA